MAIAFALVGILVIALLADRARARKVSAQSNTAGKIRQATRMVPHALTMLVMVAHASEITRVVSHISAVHILAALAMFAIWAVTSSGSESL
jgi:nitrate reductase gamma subunit